VFYSDSTNWAINPHVFAKLAFDPIKDLAPVIQTNVLPTYVTINPSVPATSLAELIDYAKKNPGKISYASAGNGSIHHLTTELFKSMAGIDMVHVPYKGAGPGTQALLTGEVQVAFVSYTAAAQHAKAGKIRMLAISTAQRSQALPDLPTIGEAGVPGFEISSALGATVPSGTPREIVAKLHGAIAAAIAQPDVRERMTGFGVVNTIGSTPEQFGALMRAEYEKFGKLVKQVGVKID
jgi:tripartite-type tricarboxylate transporter receptor subunit TctC